MRDRPHAQELGLLSGRRGLRFHLQTVNVSDGNDGGGHVPRQAHEGADHHEDGHPEQVQVVTRPFLVQTTNTGSEFTHKQDYGRSNEGWISFVICPPEGLEWVVLLKWETPWTRGAALRSLAATKHLSPPREEWRTPLTTVWRLHCTNCSFVVGNAYKSKAGGTRGGKNRLAHASADLFFKTEAETPQWKKKMAYFP